MIGQRLQVGKGFLHASCQARDAPVIPAVCRVADEYFVRFCPFGNRGEMVVKNSA